MTDLTDSAADGSIYDLVVNSKYRLIKKIGNGSYGNIYRGINVSDERDQVAVKIEAIDSGRHHHGSLDYESQIYNMLQNTPGIPKLKWYGCHGPYRALVMDYLGPSLEDLFNYCDRRFSVKTTAMLADQMVTLIESVHQRGIVHRDVKPDNFVCGLDRYSNRVYLIDFGLSREYVDAITGDHMKYRDGKGLVGTARYASLNTHVGVEPSRRDDLESLAYLLIYFVRGRLPWQGMNIQEKRERYRKIGEKKCSTVTRVICAGCPEEFRKFLDYCRGLRFDQKPDYDYIRSLFRKAYEGLNVDERRDARFDWLL